VARRAFWSVSFICVLISDQKLKQKRTFGTGEAAQRQGTGATRRYQPTSAARPLCAKKRAVRSALPNPRGTDKRSNVHGKMGGLFPVRKFLTPRFQKIAKIRSLSEAEVGAKRRNGKKPIIIAWLTRHEARHARERLGRRFSLKGQDQKWFKKIHHDPSSCGKRGTVSRVPSLLFLMPVRKGDGGEHFVGAISEAHRQQGKKAGEGCRRTRVNRGW